MSRRKVGGQIRRPWPTAPKEHIYENRVPIKTACVCDRPNVLRDTRHCLKCGHEL
jgi:hypothetical protein